MTRNYTKREICSLLSCSASTIEKNCAHLNIKPFKGDRGMNLYSQKDFDLISQLKEHCKDKSKSRDSFVPKTEVEIVEKEPVVTKLAKVDNTDFTISKFSQSIKWGLEQDPLFELELLQRISDNSWLLPTKKLAVIFDLSAKYLASLSQYNYCGFIASKEIVDKNRILWKVEANNS